jgi:hypothetical protein
VMALKQSSYRWCYSLIPDAHMTYRASPDIYKAISTPLISYAITFFALNSSNRSASGKACALHRGGARFVGVMSVPTEVIATSQGMPAVSTGASCVAPGLTKMMMSLTGSSPKLSCTPPLRSSAIEEIQSLAGISNAMVRDAPTFRELPKEVQ